MLCFSVLSGLRATRTATTT